MTEEPTQLIAVRSRARRVAGWAGLGFVLLQVAWLLVMPPATGIDEFDHVYRANSVSLGHWKPAAEPLPQVLGRGGLITVREDIAEAANPACARLKYTGAFNCRPFKVVGPGKVQIASAADTYNPLFYAVVGSLARPFTGNSAIYVMRIAAGTLCAAAFTLAVYLTMLWARTWWPLVALLLAALPTTVYSTVVAAPNGLQMTGGLLAWASLAALMLLPAHARRLAYLALSVATVSVVVTHTLGGLWIGLTFLTAAVWVGGRRTVTCVRPRSRLEWAAAAFAVAGVAFELWWLWYARPNYAAQPEGGLPGSPWLDIVNSLVLWPLQAIAAFPLRNDQAPIALYAVAAVLLVGLVVVTVRALRGSRRLGWALTLVLALTTLIPVVLTYRTYHSLGLSWQGRYGMPYAVGLFVLAAVALDQGAPRVTRPPIAAGLVAWGAAQVVGPVHVLSLLQSDGTLVARTHWWAPPATLVVLIGTLAAIAWLRALQVAAERPVALPHPTDLLAGTRAPCRRSA